MGASSELERAECRHGDSSVSLTWLQRRGDGRPLPIRPPPTHRESAGKEFSLLQYTTLMSTCTFHHSEVGFLSSPLPTVVYPHYRRDLCNSSNTSLSFDTEASFVERRRGRACVVSSTMAAYSAFFTELTAADPFFVMAGPNVIESREHIFKMARQIKSVTDEVGVKLVFKSSFDKANRTNASSFRGPGLEEGLKILDEVKTTFGIPIVTDVHESYQCEAVGKVADIIQIPAFLCRQTDLLVAAAKTGRVINIKKGQFCASSVMKNSADKIRLAGNPNVMVCERGTMFGYSDLVVDPRNLEWMREADCPVVADITHSLQQPAGKKLEGGGVASGGLRELIPCVARTCVAVGVDGIFMEVHDNPLKSPVDGPTQWPLRNFKELLLELIAIAKVTKGKQPFKIDLTPVEEDF